jgi:hypothetical protein
MKILQKRDVVLTRHFFEVIGVNMVQNGPRTVLLNLDVLLYPDLRNLNLNLLLTWGLLVTLFSF